MLLEFRNLGVPDVEHLEDECRTVLGSALDRFDDRVDRVRVRFVPSGAHDAVCRVRVWCGEGPTVIVEELGGSGEEAVHVAADVLGRRLAKRWSRARSGRREVAVRRPRAATGTAP